MAISSFYRKTAETADEVRYAFGELRDEPDAELRFDKHSRVPEPTRGGQTHGFLATGRGILRRLKADGQWPDHGYIAH